MAAEFVIIGDVAGQFKTLLALVDKMPRAPIYLLGDLVDRGPDSPKVVKWARENEGFVTALMGNHEHMMIDFILDPWKKRKYSHHDWFVNGGGATVRSYFAGEPYENITIEAMRQRLADDAKWLMGRPVFEDTGEGLLLSHTPWCVGSFPKFCDEVMETLWYRGRPIPVAGQLSVHGHNSRKDVKWFKQEPWPFETPAPAYAVNIDTSADHKLTGLHWPSLQTFEQEYI